MLKNCKEKKVYALTISLCAKRRQPAGVGIHTYEGLMREIQAKEMDWSDED